MSNATHDDPAFAAALAARKQPRAAGAVIEQSGEVDWQARRARIEAAERAEREQAERDAAAERARVDALPVDDADIDQDPAVAEMEARIADGDTKIGAAQLIDARTAAAGRVRFGRLRQVAADRKARKNTEQLERDQGAAAAAHAREELAAYDGVALVSVYDDAVSAVAALRTLIEDRNRTLVSLARLPQDERPRGARIEPDGVTAWVPVGERLVGTVDVGAIMRGAVEAAGLRFGGSGLLVRPDHYAAPDERGLIAEARAA